VSFIHLNFRHAALVTLCPSCFPSVQFGADSSKNDCRGDNEIPKMHHAQWCLVCPLFYVRPTVIRYGNDSATCEYKDGIIFPCDRKDQSIQSSVMITTKAGIHPMHQKLRADRSRGLASPRNFFGQRRNGTAVVPQLTRIRQHISVSRTPKRVKE
jgi:hypothetical protein